METESKYEFSCTHPDGDKITFTTSETNAYELVLNIMFFLRGCSFGQKTIVDAMESLAAEYTEE